LKFLQAKRFERIEFLDSHQKREDEGLDFTAGLEVKKMPALSGGASSTAD